MQFKNIPTGAGDTINLSAVYTDGATRYNLHSLAPQGFVMFGGTSLPGAYQSVGVAAAADGVFGIGPGGSATSIDTVQTWGFRGAFNHNWDPYWNSAVYGAYAAINYQNAGALSICSNFAVIPVTVGITAAGGGVCNPDFNVAQLGFITRWTPVKGLTFSGDVVWTALDQKFSGVLNIPAAGVPAVAKPGALYELKDQNTVSLLLRAQRNW